MGEEVAARRMEEEVVEEVVEEEMMMVAGGGGRSVPELMGTSRRRRRPCTASAATAVLCFWFAVGAVAAQNPNYASNSSQLHLLPQSYAELDNGNASQLRDYSGHQQGVEHAEPSEGHILIVEQAGEAGPSVASTLGPTPNQDYKQPKSLPSHGNPRRELREKPVHGRTGRSTEDGESAQSNVLLSGISQHRRLDLKEAIGGSGRNGEDIGHLRGRRTRSARETDMFTELETKLPKNVRNHDVDGLSEQEHRLRSYHRHHPWIGTPYDGVSGPTESREGHWRDSPGERRVGTTKKIRHRRKKPSVQEKRRPSIGTIQIKESSSPEDMHDADSMPRPPVGHSSRHIPLRRGRNPRLEGNAEHLLAELVETHRGRPEPRLGHQKMAAGVARPKQSTSQQGQLDTSRRQHHDEKPIEQVGFPAEGEDTLDSMSRETLAVDLPAGHEMYSNPPRFAPIYRTSDNSAAPTNEDNHGLDVEMASAVSAAPGSSSSNNNKNNNESAGEESQSHYWRVDPQSGMEVLCDKCPAGTRVLSHCTANELRVCVACKPGTFLEHENAANGCRRCGPPCSESDAVERAPCTQRHDRVCACPAGWYARDGGDGGDGDDAVPGRHLRCAPHTMCPPGWGVRRRGTETRDVRCKQCSRGTFSSEESSTTRCRPHTDCALLNLHIASPGDERQDNVCGGNAGSAEEEGGVVDAQAEPSRVPTPASAALPGGAEEEGGVELVAPATPRSSGKHHLDPLPLPSGADSRYAPSPSGLQPQPGDPHQQGLVTSPLTLESRGSAIWQTNPESDVATTAFSSDIPITPAGDSAHTFSAQNESGSNMTKLPKRAVPTISGDSTSGEIPTMQARPSLDDVDRRDKASPPSREPPRRWPPLSGSSAANIPPGLSRIPSRSSSGRALAKPPQPPPAPFDINEHVAWLVVVFILLLLVVAVACSVYRSSRVLRKGPGEPPETIRQRAVPPQMQQQQQQQQQHQQLPHHHHHHHHQQQHSQRARGQSRTQLNLQIAEPANKWVFSYQGQRVDILLLVAGHIGCQWKELYRALLASAASSSSAVAAAATEDPTALVDESAHASYQEAAYAALLGWTALDAEANLARLIGALRTCGWNSLVERIRAIMEDSALTERDEVGPLPMVLCAGRGTRGSLAPGSDAGTLSGAGVGAGGEGRLGLHTPVGGACKPGRTAPFQDESEPLLRCDSTSSGSSTGSAKAWSFIAKEKRDTILRQVLADSLQLQPIFDDVFSLLSVEELRAVEACGQPDEKLERIFDILGCKSREASQRLLDSLYEHLPELL
ncbi:tumor necrosis factor receptor superfamily member 21 [Lethenteron reissneri]|uniref:tumor necrosis factor receptor superfamily member 21 n=1 Tax=Lethenteron reissneri TaxID=7753 RepID=UPI002AB69601|nr:tumor necrosis factor receptor superfamily member 21 [Lethenteron reissneri]